MSNMCEKCWQDAQTSATADVYTRYCELIAEREDNPCTPEQQAGQGAETCPSCKRKTLHQYTGEPMCGCEPQQS